MKPETTGGSYLIVGERKLMIRTTKAAKHRIVRTWGVSSDEADATTEITISTTCRSIIRTCRERPSLYEVALPTPNAWVPQHSLCPDRSRKKHDPCLPRTQPPTNPIPPGRPFNPACRVVVGRFFTRRSAWWLQTRQVKGARSDDEF